MKMPKGFKMSKCILNELPVNERAGAAQVPGT